jgi:predicted secreted protein
MKDSVIFLMFILPLTMFGCAGIQFDREYELNKGEEFVINLKTNPATGYTWSITQGLADSVITLHGEEYVPRDNSSGKPRLGAGGTKKWHFRAEKQGTITLKFVCKRPGTKETRETRYFQIQVK